MTIANGPNSWRLPLGAVLLLAVASSARAAEAKSSVESLLTPDTIGFLHVRIADVWESPGLAFYRKMLGSLDGGDIKAFDGKFVPKPTQFESITIIMPSLNIRMPIPDGQPSGNSLIWVIVSKQPIDRVDLIKALGPEVRTKAHHGVDYLFDESHWAGFIQLGPTTLVAASEDSIVRLIEQQEARKTQSPLSDIFTREAPKHAALLGVNPGALATPEVLRELPEELTPLLKASAAWATLDMKQETRLGLTAEFPTMERAAMGKKALEDLRKLARDLIAKGLKEMQAEDIGATKRPTMGPLDMPALFRPMVAKAALKYLDAIVKGLAIDPAGSSLQISHNLSESFPANGDALAIMTFAAFADSYGRSYIYYPRYSAKDGEEIPYFVRDNFARISAALLAYHEDKGSFPPDALYDKDGKPLLSWRVLILPYLEQRLGDGPFGAPPLPPNPMAPAVKRSYEDLYKQFKLDEPWDSMHNKRLLEKMPRPFRVEFSTQNWRIRTDWKTGVQVFNGTGSLFPGRDPVSKAKVRDGLDTTIAVVFRDDPTNAFPWTKPADIPFSADRPLPKLFGPPPDMRGSTPPASHDIFAIMADGVSRRFPGDFSEKDFRALVTIDGGESVKLPEPKKSAFPKMK